MNFTTAKKEYLKQGSVSLCFMVVVPLPLRSASSIAAHTPPPQLSTYWAVDVFPPLYKLVFARFRQSEARTLKALRWRWPSHTNVLLKAELVRLLADETEQPLHDFVDGLSADRIRRLEPTIPEPRREQLAVAAAESAAKSLDDLREMRAALGKGGSLGVLASHVLGRVPPSLPPVRRQSSEADAARGSEHEAATVRWARARWPWPEHAVVSSCYLAGPVPNADGGTIKAEFDALVVRREPARGVGVEPAARAAAAVDATTEGGGAADAALADGCELQLIALVEAKAGSPLYADLPKLLRARELLMKPGSTLSVRIGRHGPVLSLAVEEKPPEVAYVFGDGVRGTDARSVASKSGWAVEKHRLLAGALASVEAREGAVTFVPDEEGGVAVPLEAAAVSAASGRVDAFVATLERLVAAGEVSLWQSIDRPDDDSCVGV